MQTYTQENPPEYGHNASYMERPNSDNIRNGVVPLDSLPAQWWNWLWNNVTTVLTGVNDEVHDIYEELKSVLASQGLSPDDNTLNQLYMAIDKIHTTIATAAKPGSVLSSSDEGKVSVDAATGVMTANGLGKISDLTTEVKTSVVQAINWLMRYSASLAYPVGSLYWSSKPTDPGTLFPGTTWTQIKDKFVYAAGSKNVNTTGGAETVTLKVENLPSHNHTFTGTAVTPTGSFSGTKVTPTGSFTGTAVTPTGSFSGTKVTPTGSFTGTAGTPTGSFSGTKVTPTGSFTGTAGTPTGSFSGTKVTPTGSFSGTSSVATSESGKWSFGMRMGTYGAGNVIVPVWGETHSGPDTENVPVGFSSYVYNTDAKLIGGSQRHYTFDVDSVHTASPVFISHPGHTHTVTPSGSISINEITPAGSITIDSFIPKGTISINEITPAGSITIDSFVPTGTISINEITPAGSITIDSFIPKGTISINEITPAGSITINSITPKGTISINEITPAGSITINSITPSGSISNTGSGTAVDKMPPYVVKYCWERTA